MHLTLISQVQKVLFLHSQLLHFQILILILSIIFLPIHPWSKLNVLRTQLLLGSLVKKVSNNKSEAIINSVQRKALPDYQKLMEDCFKQYYKLLKPGRWMTVEFSNSQSSVWNAIREAIERVGFIIANVAALDKKQGSFKAVTSTTAVKQD